MAMSVEEFDVMARSRRIHAQRFGSDPMPLVIGLHGLSGCMKNFDFIGEAFAGAPFQLVALDFRGRGKSELTPPGTYGWENHALDVLAVADALGVDRFSLIGQSMGASVAMKVAQIDGARLKAVVLVDTAGRVDRGVGPVIAAFLHHLDTTYDSIDSYLHAIKSQGLIAPWTEHWDRSFRYQAEETEVGVRSTAHSAALAEDRAYTATQDPYDRWKHWTMPTLLLRATWELLPGAGYVVPAGDVKLFTRTVVGSRAVEIDANHLTINTHADSIVALLEFLTTAAV
jgi:pimeloyl-ACP methyl ester carboxylesterase